MSQPNDPPPDSSSEDDQLETLWNKNAVIESGPVFFADPQFNGGTWGDWDRPEDILNYYSLKSISPCIDRADTQFGYDPDNTLPDIGQCYFPQSPTDTTEAGIDDEVLLPLALELRSPFPNPFNAVAVIPFLLNRSGKVEMAVYDLLGRRVAVLASGHMPGGSHEARFAADQLPSGLYVVSLVFNGTRVGNRPVLLVK